jgi:general secretion pathway protein D
MNRAPFMTATNDSPKPILFPWVCLLLALLMVPVGGDAAAQQVRGPSSERYVTIDFNNVDINVFIKFISELTGKNFIVDQRVRGNVTIISPKKISISEAYRVFESVLEVHGFAAVPAGKVIKIVPSPDARAKNLDTGPQPEVAFARDRLVTRIVPLKYADSEEIKRLLAPLISKSSVIESYRPTNTLIITDVESNILRLYGILEEIDVAGMGREITVLGLENADSTKLVNMLGGVFQAATQGGKKGPEKEGPKFVADDRTNSLIIIASKVEGARITELVRLLDAEMPVNKGRFRVYHLKNADAEQLAKILRELPQKPGQPVGKGAAPVISDKVQITADKATNSLIIMADGDEYQVIESVIEKLDAPRAMVYIEALIMEVNADKTFNLGSEWAAAGKGNVDGKAAAIGGAFLQPLEETNLPGLGQGALPGGFSMGIFSEKIEIAGMEFNNIAALVHAVKEDKDVNIVSTPQILTTDNEEAKINVGKNIPFQTRTSTSDNDTFNSFEYRDVGTILKITPHITKERTVRLAIGLEVSVLESSTDFRPTTLKRTVDTTVMVSDANTVVIGGLIDDNHAVSISKVPLLGDIPVLGWLFKYKKEARTKTNLYVFLTPHVIQHPGQLDDIYRQKSEEIGQLKEGKVKMY